MFEDFRKTLQSALARSEECWPAGVFGAAAIGLASQLGVSLDDPRLCVEVVGPTEDDAPQTCLAHVIVWKTTSCELTVRQSAALLAELYDRGADPRCIEQGYSAWDVLARGVDEHGAWAGDLSPLGRVLLQAGGLHWQSHKQEEAMEMFLHEGQDALVAMLSALVQSAALQKTTPEAQMQNRRRGL